MNRIILKIRNRGKRGYDISSVPLKKIEKMSHIRGKTWELINLENEKWLFLQTRD